MSYFSPRILFILKSVTIMNVIFSEIEGKLCTSVIMSTTDDYDCLEYEAESVGEWLQTFRNLPSSQARHFCLEMMASRFFVLSVTIHSVASQKIFIPRKTAVRILLLHFVESMIIDILR